MSDELSGTLDPAAKRIKKHLVRLVLGVAVLDAIAIGAYYGFAIRDRPERTQQTFVAVWVVLTLLVVTTMMKRIRQERRR